MKKIRFRVWDEDKMYYPKYGYYLMFWDSPDKVHWALYDYDSILITKSDRSGVLMTSTGIFDKRGREIYEGDILLNEGVKREVAWLDEGAQFVVVNLTEDREWDIMTDPACYGRNDYEVVGNIYENK